MCDSQGKADDTYAYVSFLETVKLSDYWILMLMIWGEKLVQTNVNRFAHTHVRYQMVHYSHGVCLMSVYFLINTLNFWVLLFADYLEHSVIPNHDSESIPLLGNCNSFLILALGVETWLEMQNNALIQNQLKQLLDFPT